MTREITVNLRHEDGPKEPKNHLKAISELLTVFAAVSGLVFSLGWSYSYRWFELWGIPFSSVSLDTGSYFEYGRIVVSAHRYYFVCFLIVALVVVVTPKVRTFSRKLLDRLLSTSVLGVGLVIVWTMCHYLGSTAAKSDFLQLAKTGWVQLSSVSVVFNEGVEIPPSFLADTEIGIPCHKFVVAGPDAFWFARTVDNKLDPLIFMIPKDEVRTLTLVPNVGSCPLL